MDARSQSVYGYGRTRKPAAWNSCGWFGHVGSLIHSVRPEPVCCRRSAATRRPPVPPGVCVASARPDTTAS